VAPIMNPVDRAYKTVDGTELPLRIWLPEKGTAPSYAAVVYLHGIQSHSGWYEASSRLLAEQGAAVYQVERRGSGIDRLHERGHVDRAETWLEDVAAAAGVARQETGVAAVHLLGVSWGGKLALACAAHRPDLYRSLILAAPGLCPRVDPTLAVKVRVGQCLLVGRPLARFPIPLGDPCLFTENPERVRFIAADPLSLHDLTARFMYESRRLDGLARSAARGVRLPVFLALAGKDRIIDNAATRALVEAMPSVRRRITEYPGACHTLEFEPAPSAWFLDLAAWIGEVEAG
ncbi:MAG: alpha/beta fold hydrolase, partial [Planctomycetota bacterium]|nr:alpha/beta fold hydrolase [Planctomycetota bacterium]